MGSWPEPLQQPQKDSLYILTVQQSHQECGKREHSVKGLCEEQLDLEVDEGTRW